MAPHTSATTVSLDGRLVGPAQKGGDGGGASRFGHQTAVFPEEPLSVLHGLIGHQQRVGHPSVSRLPGNFAEPVRPERTERKPADLDIDRVTRRPGRVERGGAGRLHPDDPGLAPTAEAIPPIKPPPPTATRMVSASGNLGEDLGAAGPRPRHHLGLVIGVRQEATVGGGETPCSWPEHPGTTPVTIGHLGSRFVQPPDFLGRRRIRHEQVGPNPEDLGRMGDRQGKVAPRRRHDQVGPGDQQEIEGTPDLERSGRLQQIELENDSRGRVPSGSSLAALSSSRIGVWRT